MPTDCWGWDNIDDLMAITDQQIGYITPYSTGSVYTTSNNYIVDSNSTTGYDPWRKWNYTNTSTLITSTWQNWASNYIQDLRDYQRQLNRPQQGWVRGGSSQPNDVAPPSAPVPVPHVEVITPERLAEEKAEKLLFSCLSEEQKAEFKKHNRFHIVSQEGKLYRIFRGRHGNVELIEPGTDRAIRRFCITTRDGRVPTFDVMLTQKLMLEGDEREFLKVANATQLN